MDLKYLKFDNGTGGRIVDTDLNIFFPWYVSSFLEVLRKCDTKNWNVFEYGSGDSTEWWRKRAKNVVSVDSNFQWAEKTKSYYCNKKSDFIEFPLKFISEEKFDCIVIDGDPVEWRDDCTEYAIDSLKSGGMLIIDNYKQGSIGLSFWPKTDILLENMDGEIFSQFGHSDWKTGYWIK